MGSLRSPNFAGTRPPELRKVGAGKRDVRRVALAKASGFQDGHVLTLWLRLYSSGLKNYQYYGPIPLTIAIIVRHLK